MSFGAVLRLLRVEAGTSLRGLAGAVGVSSAYLSRVENGRDPPPTPDRIVAIAQALGIPPSLLLELAERVEPAVAAYLGEVPSANRLFLEITRRRLTAAQVARVLAFVEAEFPDGRERGAPPPSLASLCALDRVLVGVRCAALDDVIDLAAARLCAAYPGSSAAALAGAIRAREEAASTALGGGLAVPRASYPRGPTAAALITLATPLESGPDGAPIRVAIVIAGLGDGSLALLGLAAVLARERVADALAAAPTPEAALAALRSAERWAGGARENAASGQHAERS